MHNSLGMSQVPPCTLIMMKDITFFEMVICLKKYREDISLVGGEAS